MLYMRNKLSIGFLTLLISGNIISQNLQLHVDFRHALYDEIPSPNYLTTTFELFRPDAWGSTFLFVDLDFNQSRGNLGLAYTEIARDFRIKNFPLMPHIEYNGGLFKTDNQFGSSISNAYLAAASYSFAIPNTHFNTYLAYKYNAFEKVSNDIQWTISWGSNLCKNKVTLSGFIDIWTENKDKTGIESGKKVIILAEPQLWYNATSHLSIGSEIEISNNFTPYKKNKLYLLPTLAGKWVF